MGWQEVADAVISRRVELGMRTRKQLADEIGLTVKTLGEIERADRASYDPATLAAVEQALKWPSGTITSIVHGQSAVRHVERIDDPDPLDRKLQRLESFSFGLNATDLRRLNDSVQVLIEWASTRTGRPEPTADEVERERSMQRVTRDNDERLAKHLRGEAAGVEQRG